MMATVAVGWTADALRPLWACLVYLSADSTRTLSLDGLHLNFGLEVLTTNHTDQPSALPHRLDERLVACRRQAKILAGHDLAPDLARLAVLATDRRLPGLEAVQQQWTTRATKGRGMATMFDTAHDLGHPDRTDLAATCEHVGLKVPTKADPENTTAASTVREAITRTLAIALVAARATGTYHWTTPIDIDQFVTDTAWDHLADLGDDQPDDSTA